nr:hypothetical protein CFP56_25989 [Quercus suber]
MLVDYIVVVQEKGSSVSRWGEFTGMSKSYQQRVSEDQSIAVANVQRVKKGVVADGGDGGGGGVVMMVRRGEE